MAKYILIITAGFLAGFNQLIAQENLTLKWSKFIESCQLNSNEIKRCCPSFPLELDDLEKPYHDNQLDSNIFNWIENYPNEIQAFLDLEKVLGKNPALGHLGIAVGEDTLKFENSYLQWIAAGGISNLELSVIAPHFPKPRYDGRPEVDGEIYERALHDWMKIFSNELQKLLNHKKLKKLNPYFSEKSVIKTCEECEKFTFISVSKQRPVFSDFDSGNPELDNERFELATKHWYFRYSPGEFVKIYKVENFAIDHEQKPGTKIRF